MIVDGCKRCGFCGQMKLVEYFYARKTRINGYTSACISCSQIKTAMRRNARLRDKPAPPAVKRCSGCAEMKMAVEFYKKSSSKTGLSSYCRKCQNESAQRSVELDPERARENKRNWRKRHPEKYLESDRKRKKAAYPRTGPKIRAKVRAYRETNKEKLAEIRRSEYGKMVNRLAQQRRIARQKDLPNTLTDAEWAALVDIFAGLCAYCGEQPWDAIEHVVPVSKGGGLTRENVVPACQGCNSSKHARDFDEFCATEGYDAAAIRARAAAPFALRSERVAA